MRRSHIVFGNESLLSIGSFPTAKSTNTDLEGIARASGVPRVVTVRSVESFRAVVIEAMNGGELTTIVAKVEAKGPGAYVTDLSLLENRFQFRRHIQSLGSGKFGLASLSNLDQLPPTGAIVIAAPLKIVGGSGSPLRVIALTP
jgi:hypothetical protein